MRTVVLGTRPDELEALIARRQALGPAWLVRSGDGYEPIDTSVVLGASAEELTERTDRPEIDHPA
jgi:hypothetical protein